MLEPKSQSVIDEETMQNQPHEIKPFDRALKIIGRNSPQTWLRLAFPNQPIELIGTLENVELSLPEQWVDFIHRVRIGSQEYLLHIEFQYQHRRDFPKRVFIYSAELTDQFQLPVISIVLYLKRRKSDPPNTYDVRVGNQTLNRFRYQVYKLWDYEAEIRSGQLIELAPLLVMIAENPTEETLAKERELILQVPDPKQRADLLAAAVTVASRFFNKGFLWEFFREEVQQMRQASFIEDWVREAEREAIRRGRQRGLEQGILRILQHRFTQVPADVGTRLEGVKLSDLEDLIDAALEVEDLTQFERQLPRL
jgi:predicted transposase YdaD